MKARPWAFLLAALSICLAVRAQEAPTTQPIKLDPADKPAIDAAKGKQVLVEGTIQKAAWSSTGKVMRASFAAGGRLNVVIFQRDRKTLDEAFGGDVARSLQGAKVQVTGTVDEYRGQSEVKVRMTSQLKVLEPAKTP